ncbi:hypothetical protein O7635_29650 [Asanoa sp. WMMD1127]|uniref:hypothetical protein n=1 Tax=Asanoa sp. WMMD1127 TaxID=3016107 RepID=UPI0024162374|nr:hypothetical protein [Asanoa sp. WMMD1127]MDG4826034.1 hypothetical protein [Asanoa sp. WMMD1127]
MIEVTPETVYAVGTDGYAAGTDWASVNDHEGEKETRRLVITKSGLADLEKSARMAKKTVAEIKVFPDFLLLSVEEGEGVTVPLVKGHNHQPALEAIPAMIGEAEKRPETIPGLIMLDPSLLSRFSKVKADKGDRRADFLFGHEGEPVLIKVGPFFKGLIMPIDREVHSENVGPEGLW